MKNMEEVGVHERKLWLGQLGRGVLAVLFALGALATPHLTIGGLAKLFAIYAIADSALSFFGADRLRRAHNRRVSALFASEGVLSVALAVVAFVVPGVLLLRIIGGLRALALGASEVVWTHRTHASIATEVAGAASIILGLLLLVWPGPETTGLTWLLALPSLASGALFIVGAVSEVQDEEELHVPT